MKKVMIDLITDCEVAGTHHEAGTKNLPVTEKQADSLISRGAAEKSAKVRKKTIEEEPEVPGSASPDED